jgi:hypothetical protein
MSSPLMTLRDSRPINAVSHALLIMQVLLGEKTRRDIAMNKSMRVLTMAGMGILAGLTIGAGPAQASDASPQPSAKASSGAAGQVQQHRGRDRDQVVGYYRSLRACELAGRIGERFNKWDDYDCDFVRFGFRRGAWALEVERDWNWNRPGLGPWSHGQFGPHHGQFGPHHGPGQFGPGPFGPNRR